MNKLRMLCGLATACLGIGFCLPATAAPPGHGSIMAKKAAQDGAVVGSQGSEQKNLQPKVTAQGYLIDVKKLQADKAADYKGKTPQKAGSAKDSVVATGASLVDKLMVTIGKNVPALQKTSTLMKLSASPSATYIASANKSIAGDLRFAYFIDKTTVTGKLPPRQLQTSAFVADLRIGRPDLLLTPGLYAT